MLLADIVRFRLMKFQNRKPNALFKKKCPDVALPPDYLMYESFQLDYYKYYYNGEATADWLIDLIKPFIDLSKASVLDWGCGPARIIRHLPKLMGDTCSFYGTDYNNKSITWCQDNLPGIDFSTNELKPPLKYEENSFDMIYGISIFTHLSSQAHKEWLKELHRVLRKGGILFLTLHGEAFFGKLEKAEQESFRRNELVVRGQVKEGHRTFIAFHPPGFVEKWITGFSLMEHKPGIVVDGGASQDVWILKRTNC